MVISLLRAQPGPRRGGRSPSTCAPIVAGRCFSVSPTAPTTAFRLGEKCGDALAMYAADVNTVAVNLAGLPAISVPAGFAGDGLPVGLQLIAPAFGESRLLAAAHQLQQRTDWHLQEPRS